MKAMFAGLMKMVPGPEMILQLLSAEGYLDDPRHERMAERLLSGSLSDIKVARSFANESGEGLEVTALHPDGELTLTLTLRQTPKKTLDAPQSA